MPKYLYRKTNMKNTLDRIVESTAQCLHEMEDLDDTAYETPATYRAPMDEGDKGMMNHRIWKLLVDRHAVRDVYGTN